MLFIWILCILILLFIIPIPIKIKVKYIDMKLDFYLYNINLNNILRHIKRKTKHIVEDKPDRVHNFGNSIKTFSTLRKKLKFKPVLKLKLDLIYGLDNAAYTALLHGIITSFYPMLVQFLSLFFKISENNIEAQPEFNKFILKLEIDSIIFINLAKVIYMSLITYRHLKESNKENLANT
ncbi:hypothetical protein CLMAG_12960 [Clostridium magnum DSM 2767]|uniref:DUF2953 domain-containing protein n=2 Tax=Clostridium magnum TaxID=33954 RepID=A0A162USR2_9CLOT|nr:hypothetical protein CLMAG_12960 [Clostridium magnum DSM 2767]SHH91972.1 Protein of unknown function [Clostridium magnum DSM 2767]